MKVVRKGDVVVRTGIHMLFLLLLAGAPACAQQSADTTFTPAVPRPAYAPGEGPVILLDEAHHNFHTASGRYRPFAAILGRDGYVVRPNTEPFSAATLAPARILVIANALSEKNLDSWALPNPGAFTAAEIAAVHEWVDGGGSLWLMIDHMPFSGAAFDLARAFGFTFRNGYAQLPGSEKFWCVFRRSDGSLRPHAILEGRSAEDAVDSVATFTGSAFLADAGAESLFILPQEYTSGEPDDPAKLGEKDTPRHPVGGYLQAATRRVGKGRVAVFGEAAMFSAQTAGKIKMGMNADVAAQNPRFLLNVAHWLTGLPGAE